MCNQTFAATINEEVLLQDAKVCSQPNMRRYFVDCQLKSAMLKNHLTGKTESLVMPQRDQLLDCMDGEDYMGYDDFCEEYELLHPAGRFTVTLSDHSIVIHAINGVPSAKKLLTSVFTHSDVVVSVLPYILNYNTECNDKPRYEVTILGLLSDENVFAISEDTLIVVLDTLTGNVYTDHATVNTTSMESLYNGNGLTLNLVKGVTFQNLN